MRFLCNNYLLKGNWKLFLKDFEFNYSDSTWKSSQDSSLAPLHLFNSRDDFYIWSTLRQVIPFGKPLIEILGNFTSSQDQTTTNWRKQSKDSTGLWSRSNKPMEFQNRLRIVVEKSTPLFKKYPQPRVAWHQEGCPGRKFTTWGKRKTRAGPANSCGGARAAPAAVVSYCLHQRCSCTSSKKVYPRVPCPALFLGAHLKQPHRSMEQIESRHKPTHKQTINLQHGSCDIQWIKTSLFNKWYCENWTTCLTPHT